MISADKILNIAAAVNPTMHVNLAELRLEDWDGQYPAYFTKTSGLMPNSSYTAESLRQPSWASNPENCAEYARFGFDGGRVWVPLNRVQGYQDGIHYPDPYSIVAAPEAPVMKKGRPRKNPTPVPAQDIRTLGAQEGEFRGKHADKAYSDAWTKEVGLRLKVVEEERRQKEAIPIQGNYLEDWEGVEVKE